MITALLFLNYNSPHHGGNAFHSIHEEIHGAELADLGCQLTTPRTSENTGSWACLRGIFLIRSLQVERVTLDLGYTM